MSSALFTISDIFERVDRLEELLNLTDVTVISQVSNEITSLKSEVNGLKNVVNNLTSNSVDLSAVEW